MIKLIDLLKESIQKLPDGKYQGSILGYDVSINKPKFSFKCISGYKNISPIPCTVIIKNGEAVVCSKGGIIFSSENAQNKWKEEYGNGRESMENYPEMKQYLK